MHPKRYIFLKRLDIIPFKVYNMIIKRKWGIKMEIGKKVKELRGMAKLTQVEFAKRAGVGLRFVRKLEQGKATVRLDKVEQVLEFFGYHVGVIRNDKE